MNRSINKNHSRSTDLDSSSTRAALNEPVRLPYAQSGTALIERREASRTGIAGGCVPAHLHFRASFLRGLLVKIDARPRHAGVCFNLAKPVDRMGTLRLPLPVVPASLEVLAASCSAQSPPRPLHAPQRLLPSTSEHTNTPGGFAPKLRAHDYFCQREAARVLLVAGSRPTRTMGKNEGGFSLQSRSGPGKIPRFASAR